MKHSQKCLAAMLAAGMLLSSISAVPVQAERQTCLQNVTAGRTAQEKNTYLPYENATYSLTYRRGWDDEIWISGFEGQASGKLVIPDTIESIPVAGIGAAAFRNASGFTGDLIIPDSIAHIGAYAFNNCTGFAGNVHIGKNLTDAGALSMLPNIISFTISDENENFSIQNGMVLSKDGTSVICCPAGKSGTLLIPDSVTTIAADAFQNCSKLTGTLTIPGTVTQIGHNAFAGCTGFTGDVIIPDSVSEAGDNIFGDCTGLNSNIHIGKLFPLGNSFTNIPNLKSFTVSEENANFSVQDSILYSKDGKIIYSCPQKFQGPLTIPDSVETITQGAFKNCTELTGTLKIPDSVTHIETDAFAGCTGFTGDLIIPDSVTELYSRAFDNCSGIDGNVHIGEKINIPYGLTNLPNIQAFTVSEKNTFLKAENGILYSADGTSVYCCPQKRTGSLNIPDTVKTIGSGAYQNCTDLTGQLILPASVEVIGTEAFKMCSGLSGDLVLSKNLNQIGWEAFDSCTGLTGTIQIPDRVTIISYGAFNNCSSLSGSVEIPASVNSIHEFAFRNCAGLDRFVFDGDAPMGSNIFGDTHTRYVYYPSENPTWNADVIASLSSSDNIVFKPYTENPAPAFRTDDLIDAIGTVTLESEAKITAARAAYTALTEAQKAYVENLSVLEAAEIALKQLRPQNGWVQNQQGWQYFENGSAVANRWIQDSQGWCYLDKDGYLTTNAWQLDSHGWLYLNENGHVATNAWAKDSVGWCYLGKDGYLTTNAWQLDSYGWLYLNENGHVATNAWAKDSVGWCYLGEDGYLVTNRWMQDSYGWCYLGEDGHMVKNQHVSDSNGPQWIGEDGYVV